MNKLSITKLLKSCQAYYSLNKYSVPLESLDVSPEFAKSISIPEIKEYTEHYGKTTVPYRIIYSLLPKSLVKSLSKGVMTKEQFMAKIKQLISFNIRGEEETSAFDYFINNESTVFKPDAINVVINQWSSNDLFTPTSSTHDIGHVVLDNADITPLRENVELTKAFSQDYVLIHPETEKVVSLDQVRDVDLRQMIETTVLVSLLKNNPIVGSIAELNFSQPGQLEDLLPELFLLYNTHGESLQKLKMDTGSIVYPKMVISTLKSAEGKLLLDGVYLSKDPKNLLIWTLKPKDPGGAIPNLQQKLKEALEKIEENFATFLTASKGKVFLIW